MEIFFECEPKIAKQLARKVQDETVRDDLLQEVYVKFATKFDSIKHHDNLCGYLHRIADNAVIDHFRRERRFVPAEDETVFVKDAPQPEANDIYKLADCCLKSFIEQLSPKYREALVLTELEGKSQKDVAEILGISYSGLKSRVQRAREMLKKAVLDCCDYEFDKYGNIVDCCNARKN